MELLREQSIEATKRQTSEVASIFDRQQSQIPMDRLTSTAPARWSSQKSLVYPEEILPNLHEQIKSHKLVLGDTATSASPQRQGSCRRLLSTRRTVERVLQPIEDLNRTSSYRTYEGYSERSYPLDVTDGVEDELIMGEDIYDGLCSERTASPVQDLPPTPPPAPATPPPAPAAPPAPTAPPPKVTPKVY